MAKIKRLFKAKEKDDDKRELAMVENPTPGDRIADVVVMVLCGLVALCCILPLWHVFMSSISDGKELLKHAGLILWPVGKVTLEGYKLIFKDASLLGGIANTVLYTVGATIIGVFLSVTAGYSLSKDTKLHTFMVLFCTFTLLFGGGVVPTYIVLRNLGMIGTRWSLLIPGCTNSMFAVMMMNSFLSVPKEYEEAARIDGANDADILFKVLLPQVKSMMMVLVLNSVVGQWNSWFNASIYVTNQKNLWPLQLWIRQMTANNEDFLLSANPDYSRYLIQYALIVFAIIPVIIMLPLFQDKLEQGVIQGGIKG